MKRGLEDFPAENTNYQRFLPKIQEIVGEKEFYDSSNEAQLSYAKLGEYMNTSDFKRNSSIEKFALVTDVMFQIEKKNRSKLAPEGTAKIFLDVGRKRKTEKAIDQMIAAHGTPRPEKFGGACWDMYEEYSFYKKQVGEMYTPKEWMEFDAYFNARIQKNFLNNSR